MVEKISTSTSSSLASCWNVHTSSCDNSSHADAIGRNICDKSFCHNCTSVPTNANLVRSHLLSIARRDEGSIPSGCCSHSKCDHLPVACQQRSIVADLEEFLILNLCFDIVDGIT